MDARLRWAGVHNNNNQYIYKQRQSHAMSQRRWLPTAVIFRPSDKSLGFAETWTVIAPATAETLEGGSRAQRRNDRGEFFRLSWGRTSPDPPDQYTVGTAIKSASFASQTVYTYIELFLSYKRLLTSTPEDVKFDGLLRRVMGNAPIKLPPRAIHFSKALVTQTFHFLRVCLHLEPFKSY